MDIKKTTRGEIIELDAPFQLERWLDRRIERVGWDRHGLRTPAWIRIGALGAVEGIPSLRKKCWKSFMSSDVVILNAFSNLGSNLDNSVKDGIENYVIRFYADNLPQINNFVKTVDSLADL